MVEGILARLLDVRVHREVIVHDESKIAERIRFFDEMVADSKSRRSGFRF